MVVTINLLVVLSIALLATACGKQVTYGEEIPNPDDLPPGQVYCIVDCEELGGDKLKPAIELTFEQRMVGHNQTMCTDFRLHGSVGRTELGCNDNPSAPVTVQSKLRNSGDCQRVTFWTEVENPGNFNVNKHPGHYEICEETGSHIWIDVEDHVGVEDFNDATVDVTTTSSEVLEWQYDGDKLFICIQ
jgi:hypothetical protein